VLSDRCPPVLSCLWRWCIVLNSWMDQDATPSNALCPAHCVRWGPSSPNKGYSSPLLFGPCVLWPCGCMNHDASWSEGRPRPRPRDVRWDLAPSNKGAQQPPIFGRCVLWPRKRLAGGTNVGLGPGDVALDGDPAPTPRKVAQQPPHFSTHFALARSPISAAAEYL